MQDFFDNYTPRMNNTADTQQLFSNIEILALALHLGQGTLLEKVQIIYSIITFEEGFDWTADSADTISQTTVNKNISRNDKILG